MTLRHAFVPPQEANQSSHVGSYRRRLPVSLERMYENTLDWEHLPSLHGSSFTSIDCEKAGAWGWRAKVTSGDSADACAASLIELHLDREARRWITRNLTGPNAGAEIWTHVFIVAEHAIDIVVDFFVPDVAESARAKVGMAYAQAYETLYDEDVAMMSERQRQLDRRLDGLDRQHDLRVPYQQIGVLPKVVSLSGRDYVLHKEAGQWLIYPAQCPHQLGPLAEAVLRDGVVRCPWHGYEFDVRSGKCISGSPCRLGETPQIIEEPEALYLRWQSD